MTPERFVELLRPHQDDLERYARAVLKDVGEAMDAVQDAVLRAFRDRGRLDAGDGLRAFVFRYLVHETLNRARARRLRHRQERPLRAAAIEPAGDLMEHHAHDRLLTTPRDVLNACDDQVRAAFLALDPVDRSAFLLRSVAGFRTREIAAYFDLPLGTVLAKLARVRIELRRRLASVALERGLLQREDAS